MTEAKKESNKRQYQVQKAKGYYTSDKFRSVLKKYQQSPKGRAMMRRAMAKYNQTPQGKLVMKLARIKYEQSEKGKEARKRADEKKRLKRLLTK